MKKTRSTQVKLTLCTAMGGFSGISQAVSVDASGFGEVLIYPYYTVNKNLNTLLSVVNTTAEVKALKVKFLEGDNAQEVLNFNLYMSPYDVWTAALVATEDSVNLLTQDNSCTPFLQHPQAFTAEYFLPDAGVDDMQRTREGHFEILEMATVTDPQLGPAATMVFGMPTNCGALEAAWGVSGQWTMDSANGVSAATGGLTGTAIVVDVIEGTAISYKAEALKGFYATDGFLHTAPQERTPSLAAAEPVSTILYDDEIIVSEWDTGMDAVTALFMYETLFNEYVLEPDINAHTEFILTLPTKRHYTNPNTGSKAPFSKLFINPQGACEQIVTHDFFDRESGELEVSACEANFFPTFPVCFELCWSTNVVQLYNSSAGQFQQFPSPLLGSSNVWHLNTAPFSAGWVLMAPHRQEAVLEDANQKYRYQGLPIIRFCGAEIHQQQRSAGPLGTICFRVQTQLQSRHHIFQ